MQTGCQVVEKADHHHHFNHITFGEIPIVMVDMGSQGNIRIKTSVPNGREIISVIKAFKGSK